MNCRRKMCENQLALSQAPIGATCRVTGLSATGFCRRRLLDVGLVPGACVVPVRRSPAGDPTAYSVKGSLIALREREAGQVRVELVPNPPSDPAGRPSSEPLAGSQPADPRLSRF